MTFTSLSCAALLLAAPSVDPVQRQLGNSPPGKEAEEILALAFSPSGRTLYAGHPSGIAVWSTATGQRIQTLPTKDLRCFALSPNGSILVIADDRGVTLWATATGQPIPKSWALKDVDPSSIAFSADGQRLALAAGGVIALHDVASGQRLQQQTSPATPIRHLSFSPDGKQLVMSGGDGSVHLWTAKDDTFHGQRLTGRAVVFAPNGRTLAANAGHRIRLYDPRTADQSFQFGEHSAAITCLTYRADSLALISGSADASVCVWDAVTGERLSQFRGHKGTVTSVAITRDGRWLATGGDDGLVQLYDLNDSSGLQLESAWGDLGADETATVSAALRAFRRAGDSAVPFLLRKLRPDEDALARVRQLVADLDSRSFQRREAAQRELLRAGLLAIAPLKALLEGTPSPEAHKRAGQILEVIDRPEAVHAEQGRVVRGIRVLERLGSMTARRALEELAQGSPETPATPQAKAALQRLGPTVPTPSAR